MKKPGTVFRPFAGADRAGTRIPEFPWLRDGRESAAADPCASASEPVSRELF